MIQELYTHLDNNGPSILSLSLPPGSLRAKAMTRKASLVHDLTRLLARTAAQMGAIEDHSDGSVRPVPTASPRCVWGLVAWQSCP